MNVDDALDQGGYVGLQFCHRTYNLNTTPENLVGHSATGEDQSYDRTFEEDCLTEAKAIDLLTIDPSFISLC